MTFFQISIMIENWMVINEFAYISKSEYKMKMLIYFGRRFKNLWLDFMNRKSYKLISNITIIKVHVIIYHLVLLRQILALINHRNSLKSNGVASLLHCCVVKERKHNGGSKSKLDFWNCIHGLIIETSR